ncbi:hypothetical protein BJ875DRAFT_156710 [Amylocarpus encephaloides]|uniref:Uncharacterized protein n=1 Tax=Amylocarpus encephaloides TaxID=45428 RepID=A0A9P7YP82_9HELO|nr:hypothetical protein BJ875DRAFT_156710 [Amylocarpus encephaloides]
MVSLARVVIGQGDVIIGLPPEAAAATVSQIKAINTSVRCTTLCRHQPGLACFPAWVWGSQLLLKFHELVIPLRLEVPWYPPNIISAKGDEVLRPSRNKRHAQAMASRVYLHGMVILHDTPYWRSPGTKYKHREAVLGRSPYGVLTRRPPHCEDPPATGIANYCSMAWLEQSTRPLTGDLSLNSPVVPTYHGIATTATTLPSSFSNPSLEMSPDIT